MINSIKLLYNKKAPRARSAVTVVEVVIQSTQENQKNLNKFPYGWYQGI